MQRDANSKRHEFGQLSARCFKDHPFLALTPFCCGVFELQKSVRRGGGTERMRWLLSTKVVIGDEKGNGIGQKPIGGAIGFMPTRSLSPFVLASLICTCTPTHVSFFVRFLKPLDRPLSRIPYPSCAPWPLARKAEASSWTQRFVRDDMSGAIRQNLNTQNLAPINRLQKKLSCGDEDAS